MPVNNETNFEGPRNKAEEASFVTRSREYNKCLENHCTNETNDNIMQFALCNYAMSTYRQIFNAATYCDYPVILSRISFLPSRSATRAGSGILELESFVQRNIDSFKDVLCPTDKYIGFEVCFPCLPLALPPCPTKAAPNSLPLEL